jgi:hypothetical protein
MRVARLVAAAVGLLGLRTAGSPATVARRSQRGVSTRHGSFG